MIMIDTNSYYFLCVADYYNSIYQYDGVALWPLLNTGVVDIQIVDVPPPAPIPNSNTLSSTIITSLVVSTASTPPNHLTWIIIFSAGAFLMVLISIIVYRITKRKRGYKYIQIPMYNTFDDESNISRNFTISFPFLTHFQNF